MMDMCCRLGFSIAVVFSVTVFVASEEYPAGSQATVRCDVKGPEVQDFVYMLRRQAPGSERFVHIINYFNRKTGE